MHIHALKISFMWRNQLPVDISQQFITGVLKEMVCGYGSAVHCYNSFEYLSAKDH